MTLDPADEPAIDTSSAHYLEGEALRIALDKAATPGQRAGIERLLGLRQDLMQDRASFQEEATAKRHARGEIYSKARVAAINAMVPSQSDLDEVIALYLRQPDAEGVLKEHARSHFAHGLVSNRLMLTSVPPDIVDAARQMQVREENFASAWVAAIAAPDFESELRGLQREALQLFRTSAQPMYLVTEPATGEFDDLDAVALGKSWRKLDELASTLGVEPLSSFVALPGEGSSAGIPVSRLIATVDALLQALNSAGQKFPSKRATVSALTKVHDAVRRLGEGGGQARFEVDI